MKTKLLIVIALILGLNAMAQFTDLKDFTYNGGTNGYSSLLYSGNIIYGTRSTGGANTFGYIFSMNADGTGFKILHDFPNETTFPCGSLIIDNGVLYGMTQQGGASATSGGDGNIFSINTDGTGYKVIHQFIYKTAGGSTPQGSLVISGNVLYGMTRRGGTTEPNYGGYGIIFSINTDGTNFSNLYNFTSTDNAPYGSLTILGNVMYGITSGNAVGNKGNIFSINMDGTNYTSLHTFNISDDPNGSLTLSGNVLYGVTRSGGVNGRGYIFKINPDGTGFTDIYDFNAYYPYGSLTLLNNLLYGKTNNNIYSIKTDGTEFTWINLTSTVGAIAYGTSQDAGDMRNNGNLTLGGNILYGINQNQGGQGGVGVIFSYTPPSIGTTSINELLNRNNNQINIFPNPSNGKFEIDLKNYSLNESFTVKIANALGEVLFTESINQKQSNIDVSRFSGGVYYVIVVNGQGKSVNIKKIVLQ